MKKYSLMIKVALLYISLTLLWYSILGVLLESEISTKEYPMWYLDIARGVGIFAIFFPPAIVTHFILLTCTEYTKATHKTAKDKEK